MHDVVLIIPATEREFMFCMQVREHREGLRGKEEKRRGYLVWRRCLAVVVGRYDMGMVEMLVEKLVVGGVVLKRLVLLEEGEVKVDRGRLLLTMERKKMLFFWL